MVMTFAQVKDGVIINTIVLEDESLVDIFMINPLTNESYDSIVRIDTIYPRPGVGWIFDNITFNPPICEEE